MPSDGLSPGEVYDQALKAVVEISASGGSQSRAQGSGFVFDDNGHVVTNQHVVAGASSISVSFWNGVELDAELVGTDPSTDLAVIRVDAPAGLLSPLRIADSSAVDVGDPVLAMGSPFGLEGTITSGIVSALHREMTAPNNFTITDTIQTDAAINHGNSGGPLLDNRGRVIGVNAQIESESGGSDGVGFAIPSNTVRSIVRQLISTGEVRHAYLGVRMAPVEEGVAITTVVPDTPADEAGLRAATGTELVDGQERPTGGDVIVEFDGQAGHVADRTSERGRRTATGRDRLGRRPPRRRPADARGDARRTPVGAIVDEVWAHLDHGLVSTLGQAWVCSEAGGRGNG